MNVALIEQATEPEGRGLLQTGKVILPMGEPGKFGGGDDPAGEVFEVELADRPGCCNGM
jgi:hypothetical protein